MDRPWRALAAIQVTGTPSRFYGYVGRTRRRERPCHAGYHYSLRAAEQCAARLARTLNAIPQEEN